jgi:hypothetical protein
MVLTYITVHNRICLEPAESKQQLHINFQTTTTEQVRVTARLCACIREVLASNFGRNRLSRQVIRSFPQSLQINVGI